MDNPLHPAELRALGALIEKESTTPEYYPLTLNALVAACNQKSNRWPVTEYDEGEVLTALDGLRARGFAAALTGQPRYQIRAALHREAQSGPARDGDSLRSNAARTADAR